MKRQFSALLEVLLTPTILDEQFDAEQYDSERNERYLRRVGFR